MTAEEEPCIACHPSSELFPRRSDGRITLPDPVLGELYRINLSPFIVFTFY